MKNVLDRETRVVHSVMSEPVRRDRDNAGMAECGLFFRWFGQREFYFNEAIGLPVEDPVTCFFCLTDL
jgi:hypothetical protein